jgi:hypothetical protein
MLIRTAKLPEADSPEYRHITEALRKRVKELECLYAVLEILNHPGLPLDERLHRLVSILPKGWDYSELASARLVFDDHVYTSSHFKGGPHKQTADIVVDGERLGTIEVYYAAERPERDEGPFLKEERTLINAIARRLGTFVERRRAEEAREYARRELQEALTKILSGFLPICANCKRIRDDGSHWIDIEAYIRDHTDVEFTHSICPACINELYPAAGRKQTERHRHAGRTSKTGTDKKC